MASEVDLAVVSVRVSNSNLTSIYAIGEDYVLIPTLSVFNVEHATAQPFAVAFLTCPHFHRQL